MEKKQPLEPAIERLSDFMSLRGSGLGYVEPPDRVLEVAQVVWAERRRIVRWTLTFAVLALVLGFLTPNTYHSTTRLMPPDQGNMNLGALAMVAGAGKMMPTLPTSMTDLLTGKDQGALFVDILTGRTVGEGVIRACDLRTVYGAPLLHLKSSEESSLRRLKNSTLITEDRKSGIISIQVSDHVPARAAAIAKAYVGELDKLVATVSTSSARREREFLEHRLVEVKQDLDSATKTLSEFSSKNATLEPKDQGKAMVEAAADLQGQLIASEAQLKGLLQIYGDSNTRVRSLRARVAELRKQLGALSGTDAGAGQPGSSDAMPYPSIRQLPLLGATYADLYRQAKVQETVFEVLTQQYEMAKVQEAKEIPSVKVVDQAYVPQWKDSPHLSLWLLGALFLGLLFSTTYTVAEARWRQLDASNPYKSFLTRVAADVTAHRWWKKGEQRWLKIAKSSRQRRNGAEDHAA